MTWIHIVMIIAGYQLGMAIGRAIIDAFKGES